MYFKWWVLFYELSPILDLPHLNNTPQLHIKSQERLRLNGLTSGERGERRIVSLGLPLLYFIIE